MFDQKPSGPRGIFAKATSAHQDPRTLELLALKRELDLTPLQRTVHIGTFGFPSSLVPYHHGSGSILARGDHSFKIRIFDGVLFGLHCKPLHCRIERGALRDSPGKEHPAPFQAKIVVQIRGHMFLHNVNKRSLPLLLAVARPRWLGRHIEFAFFPVFLKFHISSLCAAFSSRAPWLLSSIATPFLEFSRSVQGFSSAQS